ncbi:MAG TPA: DUF998 domain-containing protein [Thermoanaerobaculia bacterium]|nr:DUF998 domain-containing protein [Thermoanaerobaculia bacterium]
MSKRVKLVRLLAVASVVYAAVFYVVGAALKPGYSHAANFLSELNATGTPWARELGLFGFVPLGLLVAAFLLAAYPVARLSGASRVGFLLLWSQPIAFLGAAAAPCDPGCPPDGSALQQIHNLLGLVTYCAAAAGFLLLSFHSGSSRGGRWYFRGASVAWLGLFVFMLSPELAPIRGLLQRIADGLLWVGVVLVGWRFVAPAGRTPAAPDDPCLDASRE